MMVGMTIENLNLALRDVHDLLLDRCLILNWLVLGDTAKAIKDGSLEGLEKIEVGIEKRYFGDEQKGAFDLFGVKKGEKEGMYEYEVSGVPITIRIIERKYPFFVNPDFVFYMGDTFRFANPFEKYWKARFIVR